MRSRYLARAGLIVVGALVALVCAELVLRLLPKVTLTKGWVLGHPERVLDRNVIYVYPRYKTPSFYRVDEKQPTLVALGDSFTAGFPVGRELSYPARLQEELARAGAPMHVLNLGTGDSGPDQHLRLFVDYALPRVTPDVVVWQFYPNDILDNCAVPTYDIEDGKLVRLDASDNWLYRRGLLFELTPLPAWLKLRSRVYLSVLKAAEHWTYAQVPPEFSAHREAWSEAKVRLEVGEMDRLARERGFRAYYTLVPPRALSIEPEREEDVRQIEWARESYAMLREILAPRPEFIDLVLDEKSAASPAGYYSSDKADPNPPGDRHLNEEGYHEIARQIAKRVVADEHAHADVSRAQP
jgi:lysophospholipase L1-like esterase